MDEQAHPCRERTKCPSDAEADAWWEYPIDGQPPVTVRLALDPGTSIVVVHVVGDLNDVLAARVETLVDLP